MTIPHFTNCGCSRRDFLRKGLYGVGVTAGLPLLLSRTTQALTAEALRGTSMEANPERILVVVELSGGNDGLNTVVPFGNDEYYRVRPNIGIRESDAIKIEDGYGLHPSMVGFERLYKEGRMGVVHGCGYDNPSLSHFSSMGFWHTGVPNGGEPLGWLGRLADGAYDHDAQGNMIVNIGTRQSLAVQARHHQPLVFNDPRSFRREGSEAEKQAIESITPGADANPTLDFLSATATNAVERLGRLSNKDDELRFQVWPTIAQQVYEFIPWGSGMGTFVEAYGAAEPARLLQPAYLNHAHNDWLEVAMTGGLPFLLLIAVAALITARRGLDSLHSTKSPARQVLARLGFSICFILLLGSVYDYPLRTPSLIALFAIGTAFWAGRFNSKQENAR